ncbi:hypothetical protein DMA11_24365 [Marinilabiliaceae bacterium JC017]|nr:hypothetical protein DMA11_24365 [Marinilabiliaceae bacterium JC017]
MRFDNLFQVSLNLVTSTNLYCYNGSLWKLGLFQCRDWCAKKALLLVPDFNNAIARGGAALVRAMMGCPFRTKDQESRGTFKGDCLHLM